MGADTPFYDYGSPEGPLVFNKEFQSVIFGTPPTEGRGKKDKGKEKTIPAAQKGTGKAKKKPRNRVGESHIPTLQEAKEFRKKKESVVFWALSLEAYLMGRSPLDTGYGMGSVLGGLHFANLGFWFYGGAGYPKIWRGGVGGYGKLGRWNAVVDGVYFGPKHYLLGLFRAGWNFLQAIGGYERRGVWVVGGQVAKHSLQLGFLRFGSGVSKAFLSYDPIRSFRRGYFALPIGVMASWRGSVYLVAVAVTFEFGNIIFQDKVLQPLPPVLWLPSEGLKDTY